MILFEIFYFLKNNKEISKFIIFNSILINIIIKYLYNLNNYN